jgi:hypothetical protein
MMDEEKSLHGSLYLAMVIWSLVPTVMARAKRDEMEDKQNEKPK